MGLRLHHLVLAVAVLCCVVVAWGCASETVGKPVAAQSVGIAAVVTGGVAAFVTGGWSIVVGFLAGLTRLLFAQSSVSLPNGQSAQTALGVPLWLMFLLVLMLVKRNRVWALLTGGTHGRLDAFLRLIGVRTKPPRLPKILQQGIT